MIVKSGNVTHDNTCAQAEMVRQVTIDGTAASSKAAELVFYRACLASAVANGVSGVQFSTPLEGSAPAARAASRYSKETANV